MVVPYCLEQRRRMGGGNELDWGGRSEKYVLKNTIETAKKNKRKKTRKTKKTVTPSN